MDVVLWLLTVELLGLVAFPFAFRLFPMFIDRGYGLSKPLGLLLLAYPVWLLGSAHAPAGPRLTAALVLAALAALAAVAARRQWPAMSAYVRGGWRRLAATEAVFLVFFAAWALLRAGFSAIGHTEQPMDFAFLNASMIAPSFPPGDPWLSGHGISYYYFGYLTMGLPGVLAGVKASVVYNLALCLLPAMAAAGAVSLASAVAARAGAAWRTAFALGLASAAMLALLGNLEGVLELLHAWGAAAEGFWRTVAVKGLEAPAGVASLLPTDGWWWWRSTRIIDTVVAGVSLDPTIVEYPFFSWWLGDLHPHVMSIPFVVLFLGVCCAMVSSAAGVVRGHWATVAALGLCLGALGFVNAWDLPVFGAVAVGAVALTAHRAGWRAPGVAVWAAAAVAAVAALAVVPFLPYYLGAVAGQVKGVSAVTGPGTSPVHFLIVWGVFAVGLAPVAAMQLARLRGVGAGATVWAAALGLGPLLLWTAVAVATGHAGAIADRLWVAAPLSLAAAAMLAAAMRAPSGPAGEARAFTFGAVAVGAALVVGAELYYVVDAFDNRMNTIFKLSYQAWAILAIATPAAIYFGARKALSGGLWWRRAGTVWMAALAAAAAGALLLPLGMALTVTASGGGPYTLDGTAFLRDSAPGEYAAISWLQENARADEVIVEAVGGDYTEHGRVASFTGLPSPLNWPGHELQWRGSAELQSGRAEDVAALYRASGADEALAIAARYGVRYVVLGPRERAAYGVDSLEALAPALTVVFASHDVQVYAVAGDDA